MDMDIEIYLSEQIYDKSAFIFTTEYVQSILDGYTSPRGLNAQGQLLLLRQMVYIALNDHSRETIKKVRLNNLVKYFSTMHYDNIEHVIHISQVLLDSNMKDSIEHVPEWPKWLDISKKQLAKQKYFNALQKKHN